ncbi:heme-binding protein [Aliiglaciecola sp. LCG003]|uniref:SOUL family heme-binding protein n=1 Tax=Aliiglaciecola sp. LCG003 TaxID=3053655 RepID=UPI002572B195|nr:heme-binding protein [Aliiglaciecola sp. LCG003]WJG11210.1 heme-binding protein [Aliiglaciecola sp. LCG003]
MKFIVSICASIFVAGCSVFGQSDVETAPYTLLKSDDINNIEIRQYQSMILVSTSMAGGSDNRAFRKLFNYIAGNNLGKTEISMTAPVILDNQNQWTQGTKISMTAPVFINRDSGSPVMSFVMPKNFTLANTPKPKDRSVEVSEVTDYKVAAIQFSGTLSDSKVQEQTKILTKWIADNGYTVIGKAVKAAYNGPFTLPMLRRNEVLIEVK